MYIALIQKRTDYGIRHFIYSAPEETEESFAQRIKRCYIDPYKNTDTPYYWEVEIYELGKEIYIYKY